MSADVATNEMQLNENLSIIQKQITEIGEKTSQAFSSATLLIAMKQHMTIIEHLISQIRDDCHNIICNNFYTERNFITANNNI
jgi:hypothetical protein